MTPRRLLPYLLVFLALLGIYGGLTWRQSQRGEQERQARKVFHLKAEEIGALTLKRGREEIRLAKEEHDWRLKSPLQDRADQGVVDAMLVTLAGLEKDRDLGPPTDLKLFGLDKPGLVVEFTAQGQPRRLAIGGQVPGNKGYYALKDQDRHLLLIDARSKDALDKPLLALRDKTLLAFQPGQVKALTLTTGETTVRLEKTGPQTWRWVGREEAPVRGDRVETLLRQLHHARIQDFPAALPKDRRVLGLTPRPQAEVVLGLEKGRVALALGAKKGEARYARQGAAGPVVLVEQKLGEHIARAASSLEDRRLWAGPITEVHRVVWGPPAKPWTAVKGKDSWIITPPQGAAVSPSRVRMEMALWNMQNLEYARRLPPGGSAPPQSIYTVELFDGAGKVLFRLTESERKGSTDLEVYTQQGDKTMKTLVSRKDFTAWQAEMAQLTAPAKE